MSWPRTRTSGNVIYVEFGDSINPECNAEVHRLDRVLLEDRPAWLVESVPTYTALAVTFDPRRSSGVDVGGHLLNLAMRAETAKDTPPRLVEVPVSYGGEFGPDLPEVARLSGVSERDVVKAHTSRVYRCYMLGFTPGFVYLGELDPKIVAPRLSTPRIRVPAGSVGLAGRQTGFYGIESPGGWRLIGKTTARQFDLSKDPPSTVLPGDTVRFVEARV